MRFYNQLHPSYAGIDVHARTVIFSIVRTLVG